MARTRGFVFSHTKYQTPTHKTIHVLPMQVYEQLVGAGLQPTAWTHHQLVDAGVVAGARRGRGLLLTTCGGVRTCVHACVCRSQLQTFCVAFHKCTAGNMRAMMVSLEDMQAAGHSPRLALLERCTARYGAGLVACLLFCFVSAEYRDLMHPTVWPFLLPTPTAPHSHHPTVHAGRSARAIGTQCVSSCACCSPTTTAWWAWMPRCGREDVREWMSCGLLPSGVV